jgi:hypothetical protein
MSAGLGPGEALVRPCSVTAAEDSLLSVAQPGALVDPD